VNRVRPRRGAGALLLVLTLVPSFGCATFTYERTAGGAPSTGRRTNLRIGVTRFSGPDPAGFYPIWFSNTLADPIGDLSRAVAVELRRSGLFADVIYLGVEKPAAADLAYYREVYQLDAVLDGDVSRFFVTAVAELWSLIPPLIVVWPLHFLGVPSAPSHDSVGMSGALSLQGLASGVAGWRSPELRLSWDEHVWYSVFTIPANERRLQTNALDQFVAALAGTVCSAIDPERAPR